MWQVVALVAYGIGLWLVKRVEDQAYVPRPPSRWTDWKDAAKQCGLKVSGKGELFPRFRARIEPFEVGVETFGPEEKETRAEIKLLVAPEFVDVKVRPQRTAGDIPAGDPGFDDAFTLEGPTLNLLALLDSNTRRHMRAVSAAGRLEISPGRIEAVLSEDALLSKILPSLLGIAKRLSTPIDLQRSLVENVKRDFESGARLQNLLFLIRELPGYPGTEEAIRAACSDWSSPVRLQAAKALGYEGREILLALAHRLEDDGISAEAVSSLDREMPSDQAKTLLARAASLGHPRTALACVQVLDEESLIQTLQHESGDIRIAAANELGDMGSAAAVLPLQEAAERFPLDRKLRHATRQAIAEIQSRAEGASPGQLSLATDGGELSLAHDPAGQLSLDEKGDR